MCNEMTKWQCLREAVQTAKKNTPGLSQVSPKGILTSSHRRKRCIMGRLETPKSVYRACVELWFLCVVFHLIGQSLESSSGSDCQGFGEAQCSRGKIQLLIKSGKFPEEAGGGSWIGIRLGWIPLNSEAGRWLILSSPSNLTNLLGSATT